MHFKSLHNFLLIVLCTIGIGFVSAPPASAAQIMLIDGSTQTDITNKYRYFTADKAYNNDGTKKTSNIEDTGYRSITVLATGFSGNITTSVSLTPENKGPNIVNEFKVIKQNGNVYTIYYIPVTASNTYSKTRITFTDGTNSAYTDLWAKYDNVGGSWKHASPQIAEISAPWGAGLNTTNPVILYNCDVDPGLSSIKNNGYYKRQVTVKAVRGSSGQIRLTKTNDNADFTISPEYIEVTSEGQTGTFDITYTPSKAESYSNFADFKVTYGNDSKTFRASPQISANHLPGTITLDKSVFDLTANSGNPDWTNNGRIVDYLTVTGSGINGNITLSVSPQGNYGLTVTPTVLPAEGGTVTIIYKPQTGDAIHTSPYPVLSVKADNATTKTAELRTTWDNSTVTEGVTPVPVIQPGDFDPVIYECKTFTGRTTVSLRWEPKNPNEIKLVEYTQAQIDGEADATKKSWMQSWNEAYNNNIAFKYTLYRDGKVIVSDLDISSYVDMNVPVGDHTYYVKAHYINGRTANSTEQTVTVKRDMAITNYVLEEVYNYPIVNQTTDNNISGVNTFNAYGTITGDDPNVQREGFLYKYNYPGDPNKGGSPGDGVRQAVFRDGHWYIAMVSNRYSNNGAIGYKTGANYNESERGHILKINADENIYQNPLKIYAELRTLSNQSLAMTEDAQYNFYFRGYNGNPGDLDNGKINLVNGDQYFKPMFSYGYKLGNGSVQYKANDIPEISGIDKAAQGQYYRTHYMAARGKVADGKGKLCFAQNESHDAYIVDLDNSGNPTTYHKISAPRQAVTNHGGKERIIDIIAGTENYIFPVEGEPNKYIHVMRSSGIFLVDVTDINNPIYTLITADLSEVRSASGQTFTLYNSMDGSTDLFYIHGTSLYSNNPGHFRIDMAQRAKDASGDYTGDIHTADFTDMVPMASKLQEEIPGFEAGNSNGMWFGTEDTNEDGIAVKYIYQYVPGVRFAKYKFYPVQAFPPARPKIDVVIRHDDPAKDAAPHEADDITHFDIEYSWQRPAKFGTVGDATNFKIDGYNYELLDPNGNVLDKGYVATKDGETDETVYAFYYNQHKPTAGGKIDFSSYTPETAGQAHIYDVHDGKYTIRVTPVYASKADASRKYTGESGLAQDAADYTPEILNIRAMLFQAQGNKSLYRVDIDFNRAPRHDGETSFTHPGGKGYTFYKGDGVAANHKLAEPASRFKLEVSKDNGTTWQAIDNLRVFYDGKILINKNNEAEKAEIKGINDNITEHNGEIHSGTHDGFIKHDYNFGGNFSVRPKPSNVKALAAAQPNTYGDKMYVQEAIAHLYGDVRTVDQNVLNAEKSNGAFQAVAYHMVDASKEDVSNIRNWKYRATALYADNQPYASIKRSASVETTLGDPTTTGVEDAIADAAEGVHIWPVPAESELHIAAGEAIESVSIFNISGSCVASFESNGDTTMTVSVDNLASGVYFVKVNANAAQRLIKR